MAAATSKNNEAGKLIEVSLSEDDRQMFERRRQQVEGTRNWGHSDSNFEVGNSQVNRQEKVNLATRKLGEKD